MRPARRLPSRSQTVTRSCNRSSLCVFLSFVPTSLCGLTGRLGLADQRKAHLLAGRFSEKGGQERQKCAICDCFQTVTGAAEDRKGKTGIWGCGSVRAAPRAVIPHAHAPRHYPDDPNLSPDSAVVAAESPNARPVTCSNDGQDAIRDQYHRTLVDRFQAVEHTGLPHSTAGLVLQLSKNVRTRQADASHFVLRALSL
jgi:hypothetical protein